MEFSKPETSHIVESGIHIGQLQADESRIGENGHADSEP
jgi:hypothetical protein